MLNFPTEELRAQQRVMPVSIEKSQSYGNPLRAEQLYFATSLRPNQAHNPLNALCYQGLALLLNFSMSLLQ
jgi:hypothetical protein